MDNNFIDEIALLKAFIDHKTLSYNEVQEMGVVPLLNKQDRRASFKNSIDKFKKWELIESVPDSDPRAWTVIPDKATAEYNKLAKEIEQKQLVEKYSFQYLQEEVAANTKKLKGLKFYKILAVTGFSIALFSFATGITAHKLFTLIKHLFSFLSDKQPL